MISLFFAAKWHSAVYMDFILFIHSSVGTPLGWYHALAVVSHAEIQVDMQPALRYANVKLFVHIIRKRCWILLHFFSTSFEMIVWLMSFIKLMWCIIFIGIHMLNYPCIPGWLLLDHVEYLIHMLLCLITNILLRIFHLCSSRILAYSFFSLSPLCFFSLSVSHTHVHIMYFDSIFSYK